MRKLHKLPKIAQITKNGANCTVHKQQKMRSNAAALLARRRVNGFGLSRDGAGLSSWLRLRKGLRGGQSRYTVTDLRSVCAMFAQRATC
jgi:hypothetical protein